MNLYQRILKIMDEVEYIQRGNRVAEIKYHPLSRQTVVREVRKALIKHGVCVVPGKCGLLPVHEYVTAKGAKMFLTTIAQEYIVFNADKPEENFVCSIPGSGSDNSDKGSGKAFTYTEKQLFINLFHIETGDEDAPEEEQEQEYITANQAEELKMLADAAGVKHEIVLSVAAAETFNKISLASFEGLKARLLKKANQDPTVKVKPVEK